MGRAAPSLASRVGRGVLGRAAEKSGARNGLASCRETTDCGTTPCAAAAAGRSTGGPSSTPVSMPALVSMSRLSDRASSETTASPSRSARSAASRTAVLARTVAMASRRLSWSSRRVWFPVSSARTRARSSRSNSAMAWNVARVAGVARPRRSAASTSRTALASTEMTSSRSLAPCRRFRGAVWRALVWGWPRRATNSSSEHPAWRPWQPCRRQCCGRAMGVAGMARGHSSGSPHGSTGDRSRGGNRLAQRGSTVPSMVAAPPPMARRQ